MIARGGPGYGEEVSAAVDSTRVLRLALNVLWAGLPGGMTGGQVGDALMTIHEYVNEVEAASLRGAGLAEYYLVVRPVSPVTGPAGEREEDRGGSAQSHRSGNAGRPG